MRRIVLIFIFVAFAVILPATTHLRAQQPPAAPGLAMTDSLRTELIEAVAQNVEDYYVFPETAAEAADAIRRRQENGEYGRITSAAELARTLTAHLREVTRDKH